MKNATTPISTFCVALTTMAVFCATSPAISDEAPTPEVVSIVPPIHAPIISLTARHRFTDTTNAYRAYSASYLSDERVKPLRDVFMTYELLAYLSVRASQLGMKVCEIPVTRAYPKKGKTPTKISFFKGNWGLFRTLIRNAFGAYNP
jgi:dolichol-phosphate mannosyltransferase